MRHDDIETHKAMQQYEPSVDDPCIDLECGFNSITGCTKVGECVHLEKAAFQKKLEEAVERSLTHKGNHS